MGESLFGKLRDVLSREKTSDIDTAVNIAASPASLARIGLVTGTAVSPATPDLGAPAPEMPVAGMQQEPVQQNPVQQSPVQQSPVATDIAPVGIQFFAEVPSQECANEIVSISQAAQNCLSAEAQPVDDSIWTVAVTLCMMPVPQEIHAIETVFQTWAQKLGGTSKGWGLSQNQAA